MSLNVPKLFLSCDVLLNLLAYILCPRKFVRLTSQVSLMNFVLHPFSRCDFTNKWYTSSNPTMFKYYQKAAGDNNLHSYNDRRILTVIYRVIISLFESVHSVKNKKIIFLYSFRNAKPWIPHFNVAQGHQNLR